MKKIILSLVCMTLLLLPIVYAQDKIEPIATDSEKIARILDKVKSTNVRFDVFGTEYSTNTQATIWLQYLKDYQPINNASCYVTAYYPNKTIFLNNIVMNYLVNSDGVYYYDFITPSTTGVYIVNAKCQAPANSFTDDFIDYSKLETRKNITIQNNKIVLSSVSGELPDNKGIDDTANMTDNVLLYHFNELSGGIVDYSGENNNGSTYGVTYGIDSIFDKSLKFLTTSYVNAGNKANLNIRDAITVSFWINTTTHVLNTYPFYKGGYISFYTNPSNTMRFYLNLDVVGVVYVNTGAYGINEWHNIVGTYDKNGGVGSFRIYLDGVLQQQASYSTQIKDTSAYNLYIGATPSNGWSGLIDEIAVWNRSLSAVEVGNLYNRTKINMANSGYIMSKEVVLNGTVWDYFNSIYNNNDGSITFKILDNSNNTLCSSLGNISACANSITPIKLYAELTRPENLTSPEIDRWWLTWFAQTVEEVKGSGEMHISTLSCDSNVSANVNYTYFDNKFNDIYGWFVTTWNSITNIPSNVWSYSPRTVENITLTNATVTISDQQYDDIALRVIQYFYAMKDKLLTLRLW